MYIFYFHNTTHLNLFCKRTVLSVSRFFSPFLLFQFKLPLFSTFRYSQLGVLRTVFNCSCCSFKACCDFVSIPVYCTCFALLVVSVWDYAQSSLHQLLQPDKILRDSSRYSLILPHD